MNEVVWYYHAYAEWWMLSSLKENLLGLLFVNGKPHAVICIGWLGWLHKAKMNSLPGKPPSYNESENEILSCFTITYTSMKSFKLLINLHFCLLHPLPYLILSLILVSYLSTTLSQVRMRTNILTQKPIK